MTKMRAPPPPPAFTMSPVEMDRYPAREHHRFLPRPFLKLARDEAEHTHRPLSMFPIYHNLKACCFIVSCAYILHNGLHTNTWLSCPTWKDRRWPASASPVRAFGAVGGAVYSIGLHCERDRWGKCCEWPSNHRVICCGGREIISLDLRILYRVRCIGCHAPSEEILLKFFSAHSWAFGIE